MSSSRDFLDYVLEQLSELSDVSFRPMMGEYVIYYEGKVVGGIYDDRFLIKNTKSVSEYLKNNDISLPLEKPYPGGRDMLAADIDDREMTCSLIEMIRKDLK